LTYLGEKQKDAIGELSKDLNVAAILPCDVTKDDDLAALTESLRGLNRPLHAVVHSLAFANREDLTRPFMETSRSGFLLAQDVSAYSLVAVARAVAPVMTEGGSLSTLTYVGSTRVVTNYNVMGVANLARGGGSLLSEMGERGSRSTRSPPDPSKLCPRGRSRIYDPDTIQARPR
jgi:enoyl-[acyl-carrier protein] reductase I